jgi:aspartate/methionine/tyrosine aminotransferase
MPSIAPFKLERYFALYEFKAKYLLSPSDCESLTLTELLALADAPTRQLWEDLTLGYTESPGHPLLRAEIARLYQNVPESQIVVAAPEEAIYVALNTLLQQGDHVVCLTPIYQSLSEIAQSMGCTVTPWSIQAQGDHWHLPVDQLESLISPATRLLIVNFPHNPTGFLPTRAELDSIIDIARRHNLYLLCDEMYRLLEHDPATRLPPVADLYEKGISISGLSKTFALPGLRLGWLASQDQSLPLKWLTFKDYTTICNSAPSEILALIALRAADHIIDRNLTIIRRNLDIAQNFFTQPPALFTWFPPQAGSIAFPRWLGELPLEDLCQQIVDQRGVMIVPASMFDYPGNHFRIGLGRRNLPDALEQFGAFLNAKPPL